MKKCRICNYRLKRIVSFGRIALVGSFLKNKNKNKNKSLLSFHLNPNQKIIFISLKKNQKPNETEKIGAKLTDFLNGEIHQEMNENLRLKDQDLKLKALN